MRLAVLVMLGDGIHCGSEGMAVNTRKLTDYFGMFASSRGTLGGYDFRS